jgi:hypothetical protein
MKPHAPAHAPSGRHIKAPGTQCASQPLSGPALHTRWRRPHSPRCSRTLKYDMDAALHPTCMHDAVAWCRR